MLNVIKELTFHEIALITTSDLSTKKKTALFVDQLGQSKGLPDFAMSTMARIESNFRHRAEYYNPKTKSSSYQGAKGLYQYIASTAKHVGLIKKNSRGKWIDNRFNPILSANKAADDMVKHFDVLIKKGLNMDDYENQYWAYVAHNQGMGGAMDILDISNGATGGKYINNSKLYYHILKNTNGAYKKCVEDHGAECKRRVNRKTVNSYCGKANKNIIDCYLAFMKKLYFDKQEQVIDLYYVPDAGIDDGEVMTLDELNNIADYFS